MGYYEDDFREEYEYQNDNQWFGRLKNRYGPGVFERSIIDGCDGIFNWDGDIPDGCLNFVADQMTRFGLTLNDKLLHIPAFGAHRAFFHCHMVDPYLLFTRGLSDVTITDEWMSNAFYVKKQLRNGRLLSYEPKAQDVECYRRVNHEGEQAFRSFMKEDFLGYFDALKNQGRGHRGVDRDGRPCWIETEAAHPLSDTAEQLRDELDQEILDVGMEEILGREAVYELGQLCTYVATGGMRVKDIRRMELYLEFSVWASLIWLLSPLSRNWRRQAMDLFEAVHQTGEALLVGYTVFERGDYRKVQRPPESCHRCDIQSWCLTDKLESSTIVKICENCATLGLPILPPANCGFRVCRMPQCRHHPFHAFDPHRRLHATMRATGQLTAKAGINPALAAKMEAQGLLF